MQTRAGMTQHSGGAMEARLADAAEHARGHRLRVRLDAGVDPLGRERDEHVLAGDEPALGERVDEQLARGADIARRREHDRLAGARVAHDGGAGLDQHGGFGPALLADGRRHADQHEIGGVERGCGVGQHEAFAGEVLVQREQFVVEQLDLAGADRVEPLRGGVDPDDLVPGAAQRERRGQPDVAKPDDGDYRVLDLRRAAPAGASPERSARPCRAQPARRSPRLPRRATCFSPLLDPSCQVRAGALRPRRESGSWRIDARPRTSGVVIHIRVLVAAQCAHRRGDRQRVWTAVLRMRTERHTRVVRRGAGRCPNRADGAAS